MKVYLNNWLFNAGILGYLRIQKLRGVKYDLSKGYLEIESSHLDGFAETYFSLPLKKMINSLFSFKDKSNDLIQGLLKYFPEDTRSNFIDEINNKKQQSLDVILKKIDLNNYSGSATLINEVLESTEEFILNKVEREREKVAEKNRKKLSNVETKLKDNFIKKREKLLTGRVTDTLFQKFYLNKGILANPSYKGNNKKNDFEREYILPVQFLLNSPIKEGIQCRFISDARVSLEAFDNANDFFNQGLFSPIGVSFNFQNFYLNLQSDLVVSDLAELILLCSWAGFTEIPYQFRDEVNNTEFIFLNVPSLELLWDENSKIQSLYDRSKLKLQSTIYEDVIYDLLIKEKQKKSEWAIQNLLFVEIKPVAQKPAKGPGFVYFHIDKDISTLFLNETFANTISRLRGRIYLRRNKENPNKSTFMYTRKAVINRILARDSLTPLARAALHDQLKHHDKYNTSNAFQLSLLEAIRNHFTSNINNMNSGQIYYTLEELRKQGSNLAKRIDGEGQTNKNKESTNPSSDQETTINKGFEKRKRLSYRLLSLIRTGNSNDFYDALLKLLISNDVSISPKFLELLNPKDVIGFEARAYAFLSGFLGQSDQNKSKTTTTNTSEN